MGQSPWFRCTLNRSRHNLHMRQAPYRCLVYRHIRRMLRWFHCRYLYTCSFEIMRERKEKISWLCQRSNVMIYWHFGLWSRNRKKPKVLLLTKVEQHRSGNNKKWLLSCPMCHQPWYAVRSVPSLILFKFSGKFYHMAVYFTFYESAFISYELLRLGKLETDYERQTKTSLGLFPRCFFFTN